MSADPPQTASSRWAEAPSALVLPVGETHVFSVALGLAADRVEVLAGRLSSDESDRAAQYRFAEDRARYVVARASLRTVLGCYLGVAPEDIEFRYGRQGKPAFGADSPWAHVRFNLSRSHDVALVAVQVDDDVGVDVERVRPVSDALGIAKRFFARREYEALCALPAERQAAAFFDVWTRKEAVVKSLGSGLSHPLDAFTLSIRGSERGERVPVEARGQSHDRFVRSIPSPHEGTVAALATAGDARPFTCWTWPADATR